MMDEFAKCIAEIVKTEQNRAIREFVNTLKSCANNGVVVISTDVLDKILTDVVGDV